MSVGVDGEGVYEDIDNFIFCFPLDVNFDGATLRKCNCITDRFYSGTSIEAYLTQVISIPNVDDGSEPKYDRLPSMMGHVAKLPATLTKFASLSFEGTALSCLLDVEAHGGVTIARDAGENESPPLVDFPCPVIELEI